MHTIGQLSSFVVLCIVPFLAVNPFWSLLLPTAPPTTDNIFRGTRSTSDGFSLQGVESEPPKHRATASLRPDQPWTPLKGGHWNWYPPACYKSPLSQMHFSKIVGSLWSVSPPPIRNDDTQLQPPSQLCCHRLRSASTIELLYPDRHRAKIRLPAFPNGYMHSHRLRCGTTVSPSVP